MSELLLGKVDVALGGNDVLIFTEMWNKVISWLWLGWSLSVDHMVEFFLSIINV
jgi:hypothetical protein